MGCTNEPHGHDSSGALCQDGDAYQPIVETKVIKEETITDDKQEIFTVTTTTHLAPPLSALEDLPLPLRKPKRVCRPPDRYKPVERPLDDYDYDSEEDGWDEDSDIEDGIYGDEDEEDDEGEEDLDGFIVKDDEDSDEEYAESDSEEEEDDDEEFDTEAEEDETIVID